MIRWLKKHLPNPETIEQEKSLRWMRGLLKHPELWRLQRRPVAKGVAVGLFINFIPVPLQMLWAALIAWCCRANLPIAIIATWFNNPFTFVPINFFIYEVGAWIVGHPATSMTFPNWEWRLESLSQFTREFLTWFGAVGKVYLVGLPVVSFGAALIGYGVVQVVWKTVLILRLRRRRKHKI